MAEAFNVRVLNWDKWNPKRAQKSYSWVRLDNDTLICQDMHKMGMAGRLIWVYLLCQSSKKNGEAFRIDVGYAAECLEMKAVEIARALERIAQRGLISLDAVSLHGTTPALHRTTPTDGRTDETNERDGRDETNEESTSASADALVQIWNTHCGSMPKVEKFTAKRKRAAAARLRESPDLEHWTKIVQRMAASDFCTGGKGWTATFDFFLKPDTEAKVLEGTYDNKQGAFKTFAERRSDYNAEMDRKIVAGEV